MSFIPPEAIPWLAGIAGLYIGDQVFFGGKYTEKLLNFGNKADEWGVRPGLTYKGIPISKVQVVGRITRTDDVGTQKDITNLNLIGTDGSMYNVDEDKLYIPPHALKHRDTGAIDISLRVDELTRMNGRAANLERQVTTYQSEAAYVWKNRMDLSNVNAALLGVMRKEIGSTQIIAGKAAADRSRQQGGEENE